MPDLSSKDPCRLGSQTDFEELAKSSTVAFCSYIRRNCQTLTIGESVQDTRVVLTSALQYGGEAVAEGSWGRVSQWLACARELPEPPDWATAARWKPCRSEVEVRTMCFNATGDILAHRWKYRVKDFVLQMSRGVIRATEILEESCSALLKRRAFSAQVQMQLAATALSTGNASVLRTCLTRCSNIALWSKRIQLHLIQQMWKSKFAEAFIRVLLEIDEFALAMVENILTDACVGCLGLLQTALKGRTQPWVRWTSAHVVLRLPAVRLSAEITADVLKLPWIFWNVTDVSLMTEIDIASSSRCHITEQVGSSMMRSLTSSGQNLKELLIRPLPLIYPGAAVFAALGPMPKLEKLKWQDDTISAEMAAALIVNLSGRFPSLQELDVRYQIDAKDTLAEVIASGLNTTSLRLLHLGCKGPASAMAGAAAQIAPQLEELKLYGLMAWERSDGLGDFIKASGLVLRKRN